MSVRRTLAAALAAGVLLAGCSDDPEPTFEPPASPSPSESESSSAEPEAQSPEEFVREWFELNFQMQNSGDTQAFRAASKDCATCNDIAERVDDIYKAGGTIRLASQEVLRIELGARSRTVKQYEVAVLTSSTVYREAAGSKSKRLEGGRSSYTVTVAVDGSEQWRMESVQVTS
jgi:hypothetical protein